MANKNDNKSMFLYTALIFIVCGIADYFFVFRSDKYAKKSATS